MAGVELGGVARRITLSPGRELFPKFSPDGKWIAFTGQYDGNFNVYVMPAEGGQPKQLTFLSGQRPATQRPHGHSQRSCDLDPRQQAHGVSFSPRCFERMD